MSLTFQVRAIEVDERGIRTLRLYRTHPVKARRQTGWSDRLTMDDDGTFELGELVVVTVSKLDGNHAE